MPRANNNPSTWEILAIDDKQDNLLLLKAIFSSIGAKIHTEFDSRNYEKAILSTSPNILLLDLAMPYIDGWTIREKVDSRKYILIAITALTPDQDVKNRLLWDNYVIKPCRKADMIAAVNTAILNFNKRNPTSP